MNKTWEEVNAMIARAQRQLDTLRMQKENQIRKLHCANWQWCKARTLDQIKKIDKQIADIYDKMNGEEQ